MGVVNGWQRRGRRWLPLLGLLGAWAMASSAGTAAAATAPPVAVYPLAGSHYNLPGAQIVFRGLPAAALGTIKVTGSRTGVHTGHLAADSDGGGASFLPDVPFAAGETVTVATHLNVVGGSHGTFSFTIARPAGAIPPGRLPLAAAGTAGVQHFVSRADLEPAAVTVIKNQAPPGDGDIFVAPQFGPLQNGPMILDPQGRLLWFDPIGSASTTLVTDFREQQLGGQPVLTWWQGNTNGGYGQGQGIVLDQSYDQIATVQAVGGLQADLHEFLLTPQGDAYITAASPVWLPGITHPVIDCVVQEIDIHTGLELFEWHALDHVPTSETYLGIPPTAGHPWDPYHLNSVEPTPSGQLIVSMRNTSAIYELDRSTGRVLWTLGGKASSFTLGQGTSTWGQHDAILQPDGTITAFDDGAGPPNVHQYSRGIRESLDLTHMTATLVREYDHSPGVLAQFEGSTQVLPDGEVFLGWGQQPYFSEDNAAGQEDFDARFTSGTSSYRAYRFAWNATPATPPDLTVVPNADGSSDLYASWNGATGVAAWQVLAGRTASALVPVGAATRSGFETHAVVHSAAPYFAVQAIGATGQVLGASLPVPTAVHLALYGHSAYVPAAGGVGAVPVSCFSDRACHITLQIRAGAAVLARTGAETLAPETGGLLYFQLTPAGLSMLAHARGGHLPVQFVAHDASGTQATAAMNLVRFSTSGAGPRRHARRGNSLALVGSTEFVASGWVGGVLAACLSSAPCHVQTTLTAGSTVIARTGSEFLGAGELGYLSFTLTSAGHALLAHVPGNQLGTTVALQNGSDRATGQVALVAFR